MDARVRGNDIWVPVEVVFLVNIHEPGVHKEVGKTEARASKIGVPKLELGHQRSWYLPGSISLNNDLVDVVL